jgi:arginyl-tRNA synthetase
MSTLEAIKTNLARVLSELAESQIQPQEIVTPPKPGMGDLAFGAFKLSKEKGQKPNEIATRLASDFKNNDPSIQSVEANGPYLNFTLRNEAIAERVIKDIEAGGERYGSQNSGRGKQIMLEYANVNTHKEFHVGHLRNILIGLSTHRLLDNAGWKTIPVSYINDLGSHVAKCLWLFVRHHSKSIQPKRTKAAKEKVLNEDEWAAKVLKGLTVPMVRKIVESIPSQERTGSYLGNFYVEASKLLDENEDWKSEVSMVLKKLESHDPAWTLLWQETRRWSILEFSRLLEDLGAAIERQYYESELVDQSHEVVEELLEKGVAIESRGAIIVDLDAYPDPEIQKQKLGVFIIRKSDGTLIYAAKDIPLAELKFMEYPDQTQSIIVVDSRQSLYFKQLFATLKIMGYDKPLKHLAYDFVTLPEGAMASRKGNVILLKDLLSATQNAAREEILKRHGEEWNEGKVEHAAWCIALGGINFAMLKQDPEKVIVFDMKKALSFDGDTGPYVQYAATRLQAILRKAGKISWSKADLTGLKEDSEKQLALCLAELPDISAKAAETFRPSLIAQWLLEAAGRINAFYRDVPVLEAPEELKKARLRLVAAAHTALVNGLGYLGISVPDAM